jgi:hypothetical protein
VVWRCTASKGKVENGVHFAKRSFLAGQQFADLHAANAAVRQWVRERAGTREHGTTHRPPLAVFEAEERSKLLPLPNDPFELVEIRRAKVHPDCHAVLDASHYSAQYRYVGQVLDAWIFAHVVQLFDGAELVTTHLRAHSRGQWMTRTEHYPPHKAAYLERTPACCRRLAETIGPSTPLPGVIQPPAKAAAFALERSAAEFFGQPAERC